MKQRDLLNVMINNGWKFERHGAEHDVYCKGKHVITVPRHREISDNLVKKIMKRHGLT